MKLAPAPHPTLSFVTPPQGYVVQCAGFRLRLSGWGPFGTSPVSRTASEGSPFLPNPSLQGVILFPAPHRVVPTLTPSHPSAVLVLRGSIPPAKGTPQPGTEHDPTAPAALWWALGACLGGHTDPQGPNSIILTPQRTSDVKKKKKKRLFNCTSDILITTWV